MGISILNIKEFKRAIFNRDEKIENAIIKPRDELIQKLYQENKAEYDRLVEATKK